MTEPAYPHPPRFWWLKRIAAAAILLLLMLAALRIWWGYDAAKRLDAAINSLHAAGEKILPEDFNLPPIPDSDNAADYLNRAAAAINYSAEPPAATNMVYPGYLPMSAEWYTVAKKSVAANQIPLQLARQARQHQHVDWGIHFPISSPSSPINVALPRLNPQRELANLLGDSALYEHLTGNDFEALETIRDLLRQSEAIDQMPILVGHLVAVGIRAVAQYRLQMISPGLRLADDPSPATTTQSIKPAQRRQVQELIDMLLTPDIQGPQTALQGERMQAIDITQSFSHGILRPMYQLAAIQIIDIHNRWIAATTQPTRQTTINAFPAIGANRNTSAELLRQVLFLSYNQVFETDFRTRADQLMLAVALASRLYQIDHHGQWPANLAVLVPRYLPAVPVDPFSPTNRPLGYLIANHETRPLVHSAGSKGVDVAIDESMVPAQPQFGWQNSGDEWRDISSYVPAPSTEPADDQTR